MVVPDLGVPHPFTPEYKSKLIKYVPVKDKNKLSLSWILPYFEKHIEEQPLHYISYLIGHEGYNSLLSYLISEGLAYELSSSTSHWLNSFSSLSVTITLTEKGLADHKQVIEAVFQYI